MSKITINKSSKNKIRNGYRYKIKSEGERKEVEWLVSEGDLKSVEQYEDIMTKIETGKKKAGKLRLFTYLF